MKHGTGEAVADFTALTASHLERAMLTLLEELLLLLHDRKSGEFLTVPERSLNCALAGAAMMDLALANRIDTDPERLFVLQTTSVGDEALDRCLGLIADARGDADATFWIERFAEPAFADGLREHGFDRLVGLGILERDEGGVLSLAAQFERVRRYPVVQGEAGRDVALRIMGVLFSEEVPAPRDAMLISLVEACGLFERLLSTAEQVRVRERIDLLSRMDLIGRAVFDAIRAAGVPDREALRRSDLGPMSSEARARALAAQPAVPGLPILGNAIGLSGDIVAFLLKYYRTLGPVFRVRAFSRAYTVLAGTEANMFVQRHGRRYFRSVDAYRGLPEAFGAHRVLLGMDGQEHTRLRKVMRDGYSRASIATRLDEAAQMAADAIDRLPEHTGIPVLSAFRRIVTEQIGILGTGVSSSQYVEDVYAYIDRVLKVRALHRRPEFMLGTRRMRIARARVERLAERVLDAHGPGWRKDERPDLIDDLLALHRADPQFLPESELPAACMGPFIAGLHTAASVATFMLYALLHHPPIMARVRAEADELFLGNGPTAEKIRAMDNTRRALMETLRLYRVTPVAARTVVNGFEFAGYSIPAGTPLLLPFTLPHACPEYFADPDRFDIDRYAPPRDEHRTPGAYVPFGFGTHRCLGSGFAETQIALTLATLLHRAEVAMVPPGYNMKMDFSSIPGPDARFRIGIKSRRPRTARSA